MGYLPDTFPAVTPTLDDREFWERCNARRLSFQRCADCGRFRHPPAPVCPACQSSRIEWVDAPMHGRIFSYTTVHHPAHPAATEVVPYNVVLVEFLECGGVRLVSNVIDAREGADVNGGLAVGRAVSLAWEEGPGKQVFPRFRLVPPADPADDGGDRSPGNTRAVRDESSRR